MKNISNWLSGLDNNLHHIGEYYTYKTGKQWRSTGRGLFDDYTAGFKRWLIDDKHLTKEDIETINKDFWVLRDMGPSFLLRRKI